MPEAMKIADETAEKEKFTRVTVFTDSQATLRGIQSDEPGPGQVLALRMMNWTDASARNNIKVESRWVPANEGIEGNAEADQQSNNGGVWVFRTLYRNAKSATIFRLCFVPPC